jgi:hypothetical protein
MCSILIIAYGLVRFGYRQINFDYKDRLNQIFIYKTMRYGNIITLLRGQFYYEANAI